MNVAPWSRYRFHNHLFEVSAFLLCLGKKARILLNCQGIVSFNCLFGTKMKLLSEVNEDRTHYFSFSVGVFVVMEIFLMNLRSALFFYQSVS